MQIYSLVTLMPMVVTFVGASPILESRQPASCASYCFLNITLANDGIPLVPPIVDDPGCGTCPGHTCTGQAHGLVTIPGTDIQLFANYTVSLCYCVIACI